MAPDARRGRASFAVLLTNFIFFTISALPSGLTVTKRAARACNPPAQAWGKRASALATPGLALPPVRQQKNLTGPARGQRPTWLWPRRIRADRARA